MSKNIAKYNNKYSLPQRVVSAVTAVGFIMQPIVALANNIIKYDGTDLGNNDVTDIWADRVVANAAINQFQNFQLDANKIANMYFNTKNASGIDAANLVNFVNSRIDINGTVNAVQNSKIGGNLFFLSKEGMVVGKTGVINTGSLYVMTPTQDFMEKIIGSNGTDFDETNFKTQWNEGNGNITKMQIPVNPSGTITVLGNVNAANDVKLMAAQIGVGKNVSGDTNYDISADDAKNARIATGIIDFSELVNIKDSGNGISANLGNNLQAEVDANSGDIVLHAVANTVNSTDENFTKYGNENNQAQATVTVNGTVEARKDAIITAEATNGSSLAGLFDASVIENPDQPFEAGGQIVKNVATVDVNGEVTGQHVDIQAKTVNNYVSGEDENKYLNILPEILGTVTANLEGSYAVLANEATVNIGKDAVVTALAEIENDRNALNISADSELKTSVGASTSTVKLAQIKHTETIPAAAVAYAKTSNNATVNIEGELHSQGSTEISANADSNVGLTATVSTNQPAGDPNQFYMGLGLTEGENSSNINIKNTAQMTDLAGDLNIKANTNNSIDTQVLVAGGAGAFIGTSVNFTKYNSSADIYIDTAITDDNIYIAANNTTVKNNVVSNNSIGSDSFVSKVTERALKTQSGEEIKECGNEIKEKIKILGKNENKNILEKLGDWASVGVSVGVVEESNTANVKLTKNTQITGNKDNNAGDISITANNVIADTTMQVEGGTSNSSDNKDSTLIVDAAVLYADLVNNASVVLEGGNDTDTDTAHTELNGSNIYIQANNEFQYNRIDKMIGDILLLCEKLENAYASNATYKEHVIDLKTKAEEYKEQCALNPDYANSNAGNEAALALAAAAQQVSLDASDGSVSEQIKDIFVGPLNVVGALLPFVSLDSYANFRVASSTSGETGDDAAKVAFSGAVNVNYLTNDAKVLVGKNTAITGSGKVDIDAKAVQQDVAFNGELGLSGGADTAAGATVGVHFAEANSLVAVAEGTKITGQAINIDAENDVTRTAITFGAGSSEENSISGMASYLEGKSNSIVSIDDEAQLTATGKNHYVKTDESQQDNITGISDGSINIAAHNTTVLTDIAGGMSMGMQAGIGASVAINDYDVHNMAGIVDNDARAITSPVTPDEDESVKEKRDRVLLENTAKLQNLTKELSSLDDDAYAALFGSEDVQIDAGIKAHDFNVDVLTDGVINTVTVAGGIVSSSDSNTPGIGDKISNFAENMKNRLDNGITKLDALMHDNLQKLDENTDLKNTHMQATNKYAGQKMPSLTVSGAGSSSVNIIDGTTTAILHNADIVLNADDNNNQGSLTVKAKDESFIGAWSGAAGISWKTAEGEQNQGSTSVGVAGTVGVNKTDTDVAAIIEYSKIDFAGSIVNAAEKSGAIVAAGLGLSVEKPDAQGTSFSGAASVSVNDSENDIYAVMKDNTINETGTVQTALTNNAYDKDVQVTGGINANITAGGSKGVGLGGTINYAGITNNVQSSIDSGNYNNLSTVDVSAVTDITQVGTAVGVAVEAAEQSNYGFEGVVVYNILNNNAGATVENAEITAEKVNVSAYDTDLGENKHTEYINDRGLDATGKTYLENIKDTSEDLYEKDADGNMILDANGQPVLKVGQTGNTIVGAALGITATTGENGASGAFAVSVNDINNDFNADISGSTITANGIDKDETADVNVMAKSDTLLVGIAAGGAGSNKGIAGAGSATWNTVNNDNTATIENSTIDAAVTKVNAVSGTLGVNVAGQISVGKAALGLAIAYNDLENNTGAYVLGSDIKRTDKETDLTVAAENNGKMYAIGAGVGIAVSGDSGNVSANGTIAVNRGNNDVQAVIDDYMDDKNSPKQSTITNVTNIDVITNDNSHVLSLAGGVGVAKGVAVGGSVAYNEIGNISGNSDTKKKQQNTAEIRNAYITTADNAAIDVAAYDTSELTTSGIGVGVTAGQNANVAVQGAAATALINKDTQAVMEGVTVHSYNSNKNNADVNVIASSTNDITTSADVLAVAAGGTTAAVGAGVAVNRSQADITAKVTGGKMEVGNLSVMGKNQASITNIGVGGSAAGGNGAGVTGSVAVNIIGNDTDVHIGNGAQITADGSIGVVAISDEQIANYAGTASIAGNGAAVGVSVSVNQIESTADATVGGQDEKETVLTALGNKSLTTATKIDKDAEINNTLINSETVAINSIIERTDETRSGLIVDASSTRDMKSFLLNAAGAGQGAGVAGTVNVNMIKGATNAAVTNTSVNKEAGANTNNDVFVNAGDYTNSSGFVGTVGFAGQGAGVGLGSDTNTVSREVTAVVQNSSVKAKKFEIDADSAQGVSSFTIGAGITGVGGGVAGVVTVAELQNATRAVLRNSKINADTVDVTAAHTGIVNAGNVSAGVGIEGAGLGVSVGVLKDNSATYAEIIGKGTEEDTVTATNDVTVAATNTTTVKPVLSATGLGAGGIAGATSINNINSKVITNITDVNIISDSGKISGTADNIVNVDAYMGAQTVGIGGVGAGVTVNTIDSTVQTNVTNSDLHTGKDIILTAEEQRNIKQLATNADAAGVAIGTNVALTTVGQKITDKDTVTIIEQANNAYGENGQDSQSALGELGKGILEDNKISAAPHVAAEMGGDKDSQITVNLTGSNLNANGTVNAEATETDNITMTLGSGTGGAIAVSSGVGILNVNRNVGVNITGGSIDAAQVDFSADIDGAGAKLEVYQGSVGALGVNTAIGKVNTAGNNQISIDNVNITSDTVNLLAADNGITDADVLGIGFGAVAVGTIIGEADNESSTKIKITGSKITAKDENTASKITISAEKANTVDVHSQGGSGGALDGQGAVATATDSGASIIQIGSQDGASANTFTVKDIDIKAVAKPVVKAVADNLAVTVLGTAGVAKASAIANGKVSIDVYNNNKLNGDTVDINASLLTQDDKKTVAADVKGVCVSALVDIGDNTATAKADIDVEIFVGDVDYKTESIEEFIGYRDAVDGVDGQREEVYQKKSIGITALTINSSNNADVAADVASLAVGGVLTVGNNKAVTSNESATNVTLNTGEDNILLKSLNIVASGVSDNIAKADGNGGAVFSGDLAAYVDNTILTETQISISGKMQVEGDVNISALQSDNADINADAIKATAVGASATKAVNNISGTTSVDFINADIENTGEMYVVANNTVNFGDTEKYAVEGSGYGGVDVQGAVFENTIEKTAVINIKNTDIETVGSQVMEAKTNGDINAGAYIKAAGAGAFTWVDLDNKVTYNNSIYIDGNSSLRAKDDNADIVLSAVDNMEIKVSGVSDVQGAALGGASSDVTNVLERNNKITVDGDIYALNDVNLYAGRDSSGNDGKLDLETESETYNYSALPIAVPKLSDTINQNNQIIVNETGNISSVRDINIYADAGKETIRDTTLMYNWIYSDKKEKYVSSTIGDKAPENKQSNNYVQADGKLTAGVQNKQYITIGGTYDPETGTVSGSQLVFLDKEILDGVNAYNGADYAVSKPVISVSDGIDKDDIIVGTFDYGITLFARYNELGELMREYSEGKDSPAYKGYQAERERIMAQLKEMGLVETIIADNQEEYEAAVEGMKIDYIELPDIVASGGNINIQTDVLQGSGSLAAHGAPEVVVNNNTNLYLKINDITVGEPGGEINLNNIGLTSDDQSKYGVEISPDAEAGKGGRLIINGNYDGHSVSAKAYIDENEQEIKTIPLADIEINGIVNSEGGTVEITSKANSIVIQGKDSFDSAAVKGQTVKLKAGKSISQGFQDGIVSIGGNVQEQYQDQYDSIIKEQCTDTSEPNRNVITGEGVVSNGNMIVGENVYINAADININGYIQSGYADYIVNIDQDVQNKINEIQKNWENNGSGALTDAMVTMGTAYRIVEGKDVSDAEGVYYRQLDVYYNPFTEQIVVPDIDASGGQVYLTGRISSTGSGKINVLDGAYDITVNNATTTDLQLGKLVSNNVSGLISIADTGTDKLTEFTRNQTIVKDMTQQDADGGYIILSKSGASVEYKPQEGLRYNWTTGQQIAESTTYQQTIKAGLWGAVETVNKTDMTQYEKEATVIDQSQGQDPKNKPNGEFIGSVTDIANGSDFVVIYDNKILTQEQIGPGEPERWSTGFLGWFKWEKYTWTKLTGSTQQYVGSVKADKPISIGFIGNTDGNSTIDIKAAGNINITDNIASANGGNGSSINITTAGGAINQIGGAVIGDKITLEAVKGIDDINITSINGDVVLNAVNSGNGNIDITVNAEYGKTGNVIIDKLFAATDSAQTGDVALTAAGNITQSGNSIAVSGNRIDLISKTGQIGMQNKPIIVNGGQQIVDVTDTLSASVNAQANSNIYLTQSAGNMRIGRVYSNNGDITVTVDNGDLIDALPGDENVDRGNIDTMIQKWKDLGLIEGIDGDFQERIAQDIADYKASIRKEYDLYQNAKVYYDANPDEAAKDVNYQNMLAIYGKYNSADEYLAGNEAQTHIAQLSETDKQYWDQDLLLYAISDNIINPESGTTDTSVKDPNLKGKNITINVAAGSAGLNSDNETEIALKDLTSDIDQLKKLANADASNVIWDSEAGKVTIKEKLPVGIQMVDSGNIYVKANDNIYLAGRTENNADIKNELNIANIEGQGDIRLQGKNGIYSSGSSEQAVIKGSNLLIQAGSGSIGNHHTAMCIDISETVQAQAGEDIFLNQLGQNDLQIISIGAGGDIYLYSNANIVDAAATAAGDVVGYIRSDNGNIGLYASGNIGQDNNGLNILANQAKVNAEAEGDINIDGVTAHDNANKAIVIGDVIAKNGEGSVLISSESAIWQTEDSQGIKANTLQTSSNKEQLLNNENNSVQKIVFAGLDSDTISGSIEFINNHTEGLTVDFNGITAENGAVSITNKHGNLYVTGNSITTEGENAGSVNLVSSAGNIDITDNTNIISGADIVILAGGAITDNGKLQSADNVDIKTNVGDIELNGSVDAGTGNVAVGTGEGNIIANANVNGGTNVNIATDKGDIEIKEKVNAKEGSADIYSGNGKISIIEQVVAGTDVGIKTAKGDIELNGSVGAEQGYIEVKSGKGNISTSGTISGKQDVILTSVNGDITVDGTTESETQNVSATVMGDGNIQFVGSVSAAGDVEANINGQGNITTTENSAINGTNINFVTNIGNIITGNDLASDEDVNFNVNTGNIILGGNVQSGHNPTAADPEGSGGNINITITGDGNLRDADNRDNTLTALSPDGNRDKGNINIKLQGIGDLDLYDLYATNDARVDVANGNLILHKINGELVAIQLRTKEKVLAVGEVIAGSHIIVKDDDISLDHISQRPDADGLLVVTLDSVADDEPIDNLNIGDISVSNGSGLRFDYLWVNNADIHIDNGQLWFDKLAVENVAYFSNNAMSTSVYGNHPMRDGSDSIFWFNTAKNNPKNNLEAWRNQKNNGQWMYLRFTGQGNVQESNGVLLRLTEYNYVYSQRFSGENYLRFLLSEDAADYYDLTYTPYVVFGNRYNLYDLSDYNDTGKNADEDEIVVEV